MKRPDKTFWSLLLLSLAALPLSAQHKKPQYLQYEDMRPYHFGFFVGLHTQDFQIEHTGAVDENGATWYGSVPSYSPGFSVGVLGDYRLRDNLSLRLSPTIHFGSKTMALVSDQPDCEIVTANIRSNYIMLPLNLRYRGARTDNYRPYLLTGVSLGIDAGRRKKKEIQLKELNTYWEIGVGCDFYTPYFRFVPELKLCLGLSDIFEHNRNEESDAAFVHYTNAFEKISSRLIVLSFQFE
ncbi:MAG: PorT family protein [Bacteroidales bacterium]|nr:PorT family protein [Bacteroidales bacterium]